MKKLIPIISLLGLLMIGFIYKSQLITYANNLLTYSPCDKPLKYRIGSIDAKYNLTKDQFLSNLRESENVWESSVEKNLFAYDPKSEIEINLVYDQRSFLSTQINDLNSKVKQQQNDLDPKINDYKNRASEFRAKIQKLNTDIDYWNSRGGAPPEEFDKLTSRQQTLSQESKTLQQEAIDLNQSTDEYNNQVGQLHQTVDTFNAALQYKPEEGEYIYDNGKQTINIYFDNSRTELIHTLAHELGHALGLPHNDDPVSIMYPRTTGAISLSSTDLEALSKACIKRSVFEVYINKVIVLARRIKNNK